MTSNQEPNADLDFEVEITREPTSTFDGDTDRAGYRIVGLDIFDTREQAEKAIKSLSSQLNDIEKLREENRDLRFRICDLQDCYTHTDCRNEIDRLKQKLANADRNEQKLQNRIAEIDRLLEQKQKTYNVMFDALEAKGKADPNPTYYYKSEYNALNKILEDEEELRKERGYLKSISESD